jgi:hypothetical protein
LTRLRRVAEAIGCFREGKLNGWMTAVGRKDELELSPSGRSNVTTQRTSAAPVARQSGCEGRDNLDENRVAAS